MREGRCTRVTGRVAVNATIEVVARAFGSATGNTGCSEPDFDDKKVTQTI
jgi:hypothetical protein